MQKRYIVKILLQQIKCIKFVLSLHCNNDDSYLFVIGKRELKFKGKVIKLLKKYYVWEILVMIGLLQMLKKRGFGVKYMILLLIILVLTLVIYITFIDI